MESLFWILLLLSVFSYFVYPFILSAVAKLKGKRNQISEFSSEEDMPHLTLIVTAYNEEKRIREKIENTLALDYPSDKLKLIVASDSSSDGTDDIVKEYSESNVKLVRAAERLGKENTQWTAIQTVTEGVIVFSDTATKIESGGLLTLAKYFALRCFPCLTCMQ